MSLSDPFRRQFLRGAALRPAADAPAGRWNLAGPTPHLLFHDVPRYAVGKSAQNPTRIQDRWKRSDPYATHDPERRLPDGRRDIASVCCPLIGPYSTWSRAVPGCHIRTAEATGGPGLARPRRSMIPMSKRPPRTVPPTPSRLTAWPWAPGYVGQDGPRR